MTNWTFEPGHTAAEFRCRHMMITWVRGHFKNVHGTMRFDPADPTQASIEAMLDSASIWTGEPDRDAHLRSADFLDTANHPTIAFKSTKVEQVGGNEYKVWGNLMIRGVTRPVLLGVHNLGQWQTPFWVGNEDKGPVTRAGFVAETRINRHDFGVNWNSTLDRGGLVVGDEVFITLDVEALQDKL